MSVNKLAKVLGKHRNTVSSYIARGCPVVKKADRKTGQAWELDSADVAQWLIDESVNLAVGNLEDSTIADLTKRKLIAETTSAEKKAALEIGAVVLIEEVEKQQTAIAIKIRTGLWQIVENSPGELAAMTDETEIQTFLREEIRHCLESIASDIADGIEDIE